MAITKKQLYNGALRIAGEGKVELDEDREPRRLLDDVWDEGVVDYCLEQGQWQWATRTVKLDPSVSIDPDFGYIYAFEKPSDYIRTVALSPDEYFQNKLHRYADEANYLFSDYDEIYMKMVSNDAEYGNNFALWPMSFSKYVMAYMAYEIGPRLTGVKVDVEKLERIMMKRLHDAQNQDGVNRPTMFPDKGEWNRSRNGRNRLHPNFSERWS